MDFYYVKFQLSVCPSENVIYTKSISYVRLNIVYLNPSDIYTQKFQFNIIIIVSILFNVLVIKS